MPASWRRLSHNVRLSPAVEHGPNSGIDITSNEFSADGEQAADPARDNRFLLGLGLEDFSVSAPLIPGLKRAISRWSVAEAEDVAKLALAMDSSQSTRRFLLGSRRSI
jgi:phosphoenolpyruvate-protein kinase (PTS system EI component)